MKETYQVKKKQSIYCDGSMVIVYLSVIIFAILSYVLWFTNIYNDQLLKILVIRNGSYLYKSWSSPPISPLVCVYIFNYTNINIYSKGYTDILDVDEVGPYCYYETTNKANIKFHNNGTVSYNDNRTYKFVPEKSKGNQNDIIKIPNVPYLSALALSKSSRILTQLAIFAVLNSAEVFSEVKAHDFLFGYDNNLVTLGNTIAKMTQREVKYDKFGMLAKRAGLSKDRLTVWTGEDDPELSGQIYSVDGNNDLNVWKTAECNAVTGSDGSRFSPTKISNKKPVAIFSRDSCRSIPLVFSSEEKKEIPTYRYTIDQSYFKSSSNSNNSCYCTLDSDCNYDGVFDVSACAEGAPILISQPHFLNGDPQLLKNIQGLKPDKNKHDFFLDIHPKYGLTLGTVSRIQINVEVKKPTSYTSYLPDGLILPVVWIEISSLNMPEEMFNKVYHATYSVYYFEIFLQWTCIVMYVIASVCFVRRTFAFLKQKI